MQDIPLEAFPDYGPLLGHRDLGYVVLKRVFDVLLACLLLVSLMIAMLLIALAIKLDSPGTVLYYQNRVGYRGRSFGMLKFRTMRPERRRQTIPIDFPNRRRALKVANDPRITRVGRILRRTSLDELPQLLNILCGEMSFVGPRPELPELVARYRAQDFIRHTVVPGLTGWWQVNGRCRREDACDPDSDLDGKLEDDMYYLLHRSLTFDAAVLVRTIPVVVSGRGAA